MEVTGYWIVTHKEGAKEAAISICQHEGLVIDERLPYECFTVSGDEETIKALPEYTSIKRVEQEGVGKQLNTRTASEKFTGFANKKKNHGGTSFMPKGPKGVLHIFESGSARCGNAGNAEHGPFDVTKADLKRGTVKHGLWTLTVCERCKKSALS